MSRYIDNNPWAGLSSYEDPEKVEREGRKPKLFCGRDDESHNVAQLIAGNIFVTLYGKSGTGKTSLLNAGVFPRLRQKRYLPVSIRLSMDALGISFQQCIVRQITQTLKIVDGHQQSIDVVPISVDEHQPDYLWNYFARTRFTDSEGRTLFPVIVFDQFEEVFRNRRHDAEDMLRQIAYLMDESHALSPRLVDGQPYKYNFNFRFVISIREDDLYRLEDSIDNNYLPELKRCRYRLRSLTKQGSQDAILIPGEGLFKAEEQDGIVNAIINKSQNEDGSISTNIISLLCSRIFVDYQKSNADVISLSLVDSFIKGNPFECFYNEATRGFSDREKSYIEEHLVDSTGRRNSIPESDFLLHVKNGAVLLEGSRKILQRTSTSSDGSVYRVELIHDSFCEPLAGLKEKRERRKRLKWLAYATIVFILLLCILGSILYLYYRNKAHVSTIAIQENTIAFERDSLKKAYDTLGQMQEKIKQKEEELSLKQQEIENTNKDFLEKALALSQKEKELALIKNDIYRINQEREDLEKELENYKVALDNADLNITYVYDGLTYIRYGFFEQTDLDKWKSLNEEVCRKKISSLLTDSLQMLKIPYEMMENQPGLVYLILKSRSIKEVKEKQEWFDLWDLMNEEQVNKLYDILARENYKLAVIQYRDDANILNGKAYGYAYDKEYDKAINTIEESIELSRIAYADKYDSKGEILLMRGDTQKAVEMWRKVMSIAPDYLDYHNGSTPFYEKLDSLGLIK